MNNYEKTKEIFNLSGIRTEKSVVFLSPEQIQLFTHAKSTKGSENLRIRMAESVRKYGILHPFSVRIWQASSGFSCYQLVEEEERFRAVCMAGITRIPCLVLPGEDKRCAALALIDEYLRNHIHFLDEARLFERLMQEFSMKQTEIAEKCGLSQSSVANKLRLLQLSEGEQESIRRAGLGERHARCLLRLNDAKTRQNALETVILRHLSVVQTEDLVEKLSDPARSARTSQGAEPLNPKAPAEPKADLFEGMISREESRPSLLSSDRYEPFSCQAPAKNVAQPPTLSKSSFYCGHEYPAKSPVFSADSPAGSTSEAPFDSSLKQSVRRRITAEIPAPGGIMPRKFILHDLQPLYNSIEKTLSIFRKTGMNAECTREEAEDAVHIYIRIPRKSGAQ